MDYYLSIDNIVHDQVLVGLLSLALLLFSYLTGKLIVRPGADGMAFGFLVWGGASNIALAIFLWLRIPTSLFGWAVALIAALIVAALRRLVGGIGDTAEKDVGFSLAAGVFVFLIVIITSVLTVEPSTSYSALQAWNPLYIHHSFLAGYFARAEDMGFGEGFYTSTLWYGPDILGFVGLHEWVLGGSAGIANMAISATASFLTLAVLMRALKGDRLSLILFICVSLVFLRYSAPFTITIANNWNDKYLPLASALALSSVLSFPNQTQGFRGGFAASAFLVFARNYGAVISVVFGAFFAFLERRLTPKFAYLPWIALTALLGVFASREVFLALYIGVFATRSSMMDVYPPAFSKSFWGTVTDWGMYPHETIFVFGFPIGTVSLAALCVGILFSRRRKESVVPLLIPWIVLIAPIVVEAVSGYRQSVGFSKLYLVASWFFAWYPCFVFSFTKSGNRLLRLSSRFIDAKRVAWGIFAALIIAMIGLVGIKAVRNGGLYVYWKSMTNTYLANNSDYLMYRELRALPEPLRSSVVERKILIFHQEPGSGLRYFLGGDFFEDLDFWSVPVDQAAAESENLTELWARLGCPNIYSGFDQVIKGYERWVPYTHWHTVARELDELAQQPWVTHRLKSDIGTFYITDPGLASASFCG